MESRTAIAAKFSEIGRLSNLLALSANHVVEASIIISKISDQVFQLSELLTNSDVQTFSHIVVEAMRSAKMPLSLQIFWKWISGHLLVNKREPTTVCSNRNKDALQMGVITTNVTCFWRTLFMLLNTIEPFIFETDPKWQGVDVSRSQIIKDQR
jgi:hypothetical protein